MCGESHPLAQLTTHDVRLIRQLREEGLSFRRIAEKFEAPERTIRDICSYTTRIWE